MVAAGDGPIYGSNEYILINNIPISNVNIYQSLTHEEVESDDLLIPIIRSTRFLISCSQL